MSRAMLLRSSFSQRIASILPQNTSQSYLPSITNISQNKNPFKFVKYHLNIAAKVIYAIKKCASRQKGPHHDSAAFHSFPVTNMCTNLRGPNMFCFCIYKNKYIYIAVAHATNSFHMHSASCGTRAREWQWRTKQMKKAPAGMCERKRVRASAPLCKIAIVHLGGSSLHIPFCLDDNQSLHFANRGNTLDDDILWGAGLQPLCQTLCPRFRSTF